jgi:transcriptional regulator with XRE-family HTH domain
MRRTSRQAVNLRQGEFATLAGITASAYSRYENAKRFMGLDQAIKRGAR